MKVVLALTGVIAVCEKDEYRLDFGIDPHRDPGKAGMSEGPRYE